MKIPDHRFAVPNESSIVLDTHWQMCGTEPGFISGPDDLESIGDWLAVDQLAPVAAVLQQRGLWSLDHPAKRFDAKDWWFQLYFDVPETPQSDNLALVFDGLATLAEVWLNGEKILASDNMFVQHICPVAAHLKPSANHLLLAFRSLDLHLAKRRLRPRWRVPMLDNQQLRWSRTTLLGRTPGWSPPAAVVGPWCPIWIQRPHRLALKELTLKPSLQGSTGLLEICCRFEQDHLLAASPAAVLLTLLRHESRHQIVLTRTDDEVSGTFSALLKIDEVERWWPHTHGVPARYAAQLQVQLRGETDLYTISIGQVGFRSVEIVAERGSFVLHVNGVPVFCRGACWTPLDPVTLHVASEKYATAVAQVREAGMNMLRLSGAMTYEATAFYEACAENGIMVWQEFMFANMDYPDEANFLANVRQEARQQLLRWQACPALVVFCGNSEVEQQAAMWGTDRAYWTPELFHRELAEMAQDCCPQSPYWPSSAHAGTFPHQNDVGTTSYYGVGAYLRPLDDARRSQVKFATECLAFANIPEPSNIGRIPNAAGQIKVHHPAWKERVPRDLSAGWDFEDVRDHYTKTLFGLDPMLLRYADHERYLLLGRMTSGEIMSAAFNEWRSRQSPCEGALIWFLRDLWPGAGWGIIDSDGTPKAPFYYLKRVLQPLAVSISDEGNNGLYVHLFNESDTAVSVVARVSVFNAGHEVTSPASRTLELPARSRSTHPLLAWFDQFIDFSNSYRFGPAFADVIHVKMTMRDQEISREAFFFPLGLGHLGNNQVSIDALASPLQNGDLMVSIKCSDLAIAVHFDTADHFPDDNYFNLLPGIEKQILLRSKSGKIGSPVYLGAFNIRNTIRIPLKAKVVDDI